MILVKKHILFAFFLIVTISLSAQYEYEWNDYYDTKSMEEVASLTRCSSGEIIMTGIAKDTTDVMWIVKTTPSGEQLRSVIYTEYPLLHPVKVIETHDKNILFAGTVAEGDSVPHKIWLMKIDQFGRILWERLYSGIGDAYCTDIAETFDRGIVVSGYTAINTDEFPDWYILKVDSVGFKQWDKTFGSKYDDRALGIDQMYDSSIIVVGYMGYSYGGFKRASMSRFTKSGAELNYADLRFAEWSTANAVVASSDSTYVIATEVKKQKLIDFDIKIMKLKPNGDTVWTYTLENTDMQHPVSIIQTYDEGYAIAYTNKEDGVFNSNVAVIKLTPFGKLAWQRVFRRKSDDFAAQVIECLDNSLMIAATNYNIDKGWNYGLLKFKSLEMSDLIFLKPATPVATVTMPYLPVDAYITGYKKPIEVKIYVNKQLVSIVKSFKLDFGDNYEHHFLLQKDIPLKAGENIIDFVVTDYKEYKFVKTRRIFYLPNPSPHW